MKKIQFMSMIMLAMIVLPFIVSCSKDDDGDKNKKNQDYTENDYGSLSGKTFTVVDYFYSPTKVAIYSFSAGTGTRHTFDWEYSDEDNPSFFDGKYYFPQLDQDFTEVYSYDNHHLLTDEGVEYFTYRYSSKKDLYRIDMGYDPTQKYPYVYFRLKYDGNNYILIECDEFGSEYSSNWSKIYSQELNCYRYSSSGGGGNGGGGGSDNEPAEEWVKVRADGYMPYWYCPTGDLPISSTKHYTSDIDAYKNTKTGAYKVRWAGVEYTAHKGNNKITLDTDPHSVYNEKYKYWSSHTDYYYYEFTIYD